MRSNYSKSVSIVGVLLVLAFLIAILFPNTAMFGYYRQRIDVTQIGVTISEGRFVEVVGPGTYDDPFRWYTDIHPVSISGVPFTAVDPDVLTSDNQPIGVEVSGNIFRPGLLELNEQLWSAYRPIYQSDELLITQVTPLARQAMKVCVGQRTFVQAAVGSDRTALSECLDSELTLLLADFKLEVNNVVVPNITLSASAQAILAALTESRGQTDLAEQNTLLARAESDRNLAVRQGAIRVEEGERQERIRQDTETARLDAGRLAAQQEVIEAQNANNLLQVNGDLVVAKVEQEVAKEEAQSTTAGEAALAEIIQNNPGYAAILYSENLANVLDNAELIFLPTGTDPFLMFGDSGIVAPVVDVSPSS